MRHGANRAIIFLEKTTMNKIILHKIVITSLIGAGCAVLGISAGIAFKDRVFVLLSLAVLVMSLAKAFNLYLIDKRKKYFEVYGVCTGITPGRLTGTKTVKITNGDNEYEVVVPKNVKIKEKQKYTLCFKQIGDISALDNKFIKTRILSDNFIGISGA